MRTRLAAIAALLCAMPAGGQPVALPREAIDALAPFDSVPPTSVLNKVFPMPLVDLGTIALDPVQDLGITLRAIRALPSYCPAPPQVCDSTAEAHQTLISLIDAFRTAFQTETTPQNLLRLRAAVEALGATRSGLKADADLLTLLETQLDAQLRQLGARDLHVIVLRAVHSICNVQTLDPLIQPSPAGRDLQGSVTSTALTDLGQCN
jgi:hypothetical protein